jgi:quercetin dioxygenase-like cupin family protein
MPSPQPSVLSPDEGEKFLAGPFAITTRVDGSQSGETFELYELDMAGPATIDYHVHLLREETLTVLEGEVEFNVAGEKFLRPAGSVAFIPRGVHHGFRNPGPGRARVLVLFTPSKSQEEYFRGLQALFSAAELDVAALNALQAKYDQVRIPEGT